MPLTSSLEILPFTEEHHMVREVVRTLVDTKIGPRALHVDETHEFPMQAMQELAELDLLGVYVPEQYGGTELDFTTYYIIMEELARGCGSTALTYTAHSGLCITPLLAHGTHEQKQKYLPPLCSGQHIGCFGLTEPQSGSDSGAAETRATHDGDSWVLRGSKMWITNGDHAQTMVCVAKTDPTQPRSKGLSAFIVEMDWPGVSVPKIEDKLGLRGSSTAQIFLDDVRVPQENLLGVLDNGFGGFMKTLEAGRIAIAAMACGLAAAALERAARYATQRETFGLPLIQHQTIGNYLAEMATKLDAARLLTYRASFLKDAGKPFAKEASMAKYFASEAAMEICERAIQIHGGYGYVREFEVERIWRDAKLCTIGEGTTEVQQMIIARALAKELGA
jgi:alkylation response protein AidB-like acyl-CoA dehydrogenase